MENLPNATFKLTTHFYLTDNKDLIVVHTRNTGYEAQVAWIFLIIISVVK